MAYITRELERKFLKLNDFFKVILVTGARQVGKTTMLKHLAGSDRTYVTMDNTMARDLAQSDPVLFFQTYKPPILIDEVQKAPELFEQIKIICDESDEKGLIWLTGSQQYNMMKRVRETLAGRIGILEPRHARRMRSASSTRRSLSGPVRRRTDIGHLTMPARISSKPRKRTGSSTGARSMANV